MKEEDHPREEHLLAYAAATLAEGEQEVIEKHLAVCPICSAYCRKAFVFERLWASDARAHGDVVCRIALDEALAAEEGRASPGRRERLARWKQKWSGLAEAAASVAVDTARAGTEVFADGIASLTRPSSPWQLTPAGATTVRGAARSAESALLTTPESSSASRLRLSVTGGSKPEVIVRIDGFEPDPPPLVVLAPAGDGAEVGRTRIAEAERRPGEGYLIARFEDLPAGAYVVAVEPVLGADGSEPEGSR